MASEVPGGHADIPSAPAQDGSSAEAHPLGLLSLEQELQEAGPSPEHAQGRIERLQADAALVKVLREDGFTGPRYKIFATMLLDYGWKTMMSMTESGSIFSRARALGRPVAPHTMTSSWTEADRSAISTDSVTAGLEMFRRYALIGGAWRPEGGASLPTYFVGASVRAFPQVYRKWHREQLRELLELGREAELHVLPALLPGQQGADPADVAVTEDRIARALKLIQDPDLRRSLGLHAIGYTHAEAALQVGITPKALERRLDRARTKVRADQLAWDTAREEGGSAR